LTISNLILNYLRLKNFIIFNIPQYQMINFIHIPKNAGTSLGKLIKTEAIEGLNYCNHWVDVDTTNKPHLVILRDPIDRFTSAFFYSKRYPKSLLSEMSDINNPNDLAERLEEGETHLIKSPKHYVGKKIRGLSFVFTPQHYWINDPEYVLNYHNLEEDFKNFLKEIGHVNLTLPIINKSKKKDFKYSEKALNFINNFYREDFHLMDNYTR
jgi:hypothetical protein